jgi:hypothetical protein
MGRLPEETMGPQQTLWSKIAGWFAPFLFLGRSSSKKKHTAQARMDEAWPPLPHGEIKPPWVAYPEYGPGDTFWRQTGEPFMALVWEPYYESLSQEEKDAYLKRWQVPEEWWKFYFDPAWRAFLESTDEDQGGCRLR